MDVENMDCAVSVVVSGIVLPCCYVQACNDFGIEPRKNRVHWFDFYAEYKRFQEFILHLVDCKIDFWIEFDGMEIYEYGKEGVNKNTES